MNPIVMNPIANEAKTWNGRSMKKLLGTIAFLLSIGGMLNFTGCTTNPETGRHQLNLISGGQEMQLGLTSFDQLKKETPISRDPAANALVQKVGRRIAAIVPRNELPNAQWEFVVFESKEANAFCLPGGKVGVYTGLLPITQTEEGLATVLGHEIAHAALHHGSERMSEAMLMQTGGQVLGSALGSASPQMQAAASTAYGLTTTVGRELPHSRLQESEADRVGLSFMARAGYNPQSALSFWQRFASYSSQNGGSGTPAFLRTHPTDAKRIADLQKSLPQAMAEYQRTGGHSSSMAPTGKQSGERLSPSSGSIGSTPIGRPIR
jgi:predicted Zn-dependent protease